MTQQISKNFEYMGRWWLPNVPEKKYQGILKKDSKGIYLSLEEYELPITEHANRDDEIKKYYIVLGEMVDGTLITLQNCIYSNSTSYGIKNRKTTYYIQTAFFGGHFQKPEDITFKKLFIAYTYLDEWVNIFPWESEVLSKDGESKFVYKTPNIPSVKINEEVSIGITHDIYYPASSFYQNSATLSQKAFVEIEFASSKSLDDAQKSLQTMRDFLVFATQKNVSLDVLRGFSDNNTRKYGNQEHYTPTVIVSHDLFDSDIKKVSTSDFLFTFEEIASNSETIFKKWFELYADIEQIIHLYTIRFYNQSTYLEYQFLSLVQAIEGYHRIRLGGKYMSEEKYLQEAFPPLVGAIPQSINGSFKQALISRLKWGYEYSFAKRIKELLRTIDTSLIDMFISKKDQFMNSVKDTRNSLVHQDKDSDKRIVDENELYRLTVQLQIVMEILMLKNLNFSNEEIKKFIERKLTKFNVQELKNG